MQIDHQHGCPCDSPDQQDEDCGVCCACPCHGTWPASLYTLSYIPVISELALRKSFQFIPEVYLSKFIPPQLTA
jgi:hypothetical protein